MMPEPVAPDLELLIAEAESRPVRGWDFSGFGSRIVTSPLPWDYDSLVLRRARASPDLLDLGTGGGEWLAELPFRPARTVATETWEPNVEVAAARLEPLGVTVVRAEAAPDNVAQRREEIRGQLPFPDESFHLVACRHESYVPKEVIRVLAAGGHFLTQQVGGFYDDFHRLLGLLSPPRPEPEWNLALATVQLEAAGLRVLASGEGEETTSFADVGAIVWYLRAVPWTVPGFAAREHLGRLGELNARIERDGPVVVRLPSFYVEARRG